MTVSGRGLSASSLPCGVSLSFSLLESLVLTESVTGVSVAVFASRFPSFITPVAAAVDPVDKVSVEMTTLCKMCVGIYGRSFPISTLSGLCEGTSSRIPTNPQTPCWTYARIKDASFFTVFI